LLASTGLQRLADAIKLDAASVPRSVRYPPVTKRVTLPEKVSVRFSAEFSGQGLLTIIRVLHELGIAVDVNRSVDFEDAQRILRRYGIGAERAGHD